MENENENEMEKDYKVRGLIEDENRERSPSIYREHEQNQNGLNGSNGMSVPRHSLSIQDLSFTVKTWTGSWWACGCCRQITKQVLNHLDLTVKSGQIVALIGNSGSGKTSILNVIASRQSGDTKGSIKLNGRPLTSGLFTQKAAYCIQADRLLANLTVRETLEYTAKLKFCGRSSQKDISSKVERSLRQMSLGHVADSLVGGLAVRGISGGEKRRLSIAVQLLQNPELILLDEPTTGLDSYTAHYLIETLAALAHNDNKMVVISIHQPRSDIYHLLDTVGILSGGNMVYYGPRKELVTHFTKLGYPCPTYANPLDYYIDLASVDRRSAVREDSSLERVTAFCSAYKQSAIYDNIQADLTSEPADESKSHSGNTNNDTTQEHGQSHGQSSSKGSDISSHVYYDGPVDDPIRKRQCFGATRFFGLIGVIASRLFLFQWRDKVGFINRLLMLPFFAFFNWIYVWRLDLSMGGIQDRIGLFYQSTSFCASIGVIVAAPIFPVVRNLYYRESGDGLYNCVHFLIAYYIHILPFHVLSCFLFSIWQYWGIGMHPDPARFAIFFVVCFVQNHIGELHCVFLNGLFYNPDIALATGTLTLAISALYASGFLKSIQRLFLPLTYFTYINHYKYASEVVAANELMGLEFNCSSTSAINCTISGEQVLDGLLPDAKDNFLMNFGIMAAMIVAYWILPIIMFVAKGRRVMH